MAKMGDRIILTSEIGVFEGIFLSEKDGIIIMKLENGYQIGIAKEKIKETTVLSPASQNIVHSKKAGPKSEDASLPVISILHTGGTIASKVDYETGAVKAQFKPEELLEMVPELSKIARIRSRLVRNMMSDDMRFAHYNLIAREIEKEANEGVDGIIITQGTDTLHYTAAALAFILNGLSIPVIVVGSQRSSDRGSSDAAYNLISAAYFIAKSDFSGVAICMHYTTEDTIAAILNPCKTRKMHSSRRDAFRPVNSEEIALVNYNAGTVDFKLSSYKKKSKAYSIKLMQIKENLKIAIVKSHPNMNACELSCFEGFDGIVLEGTGLGHMPISKTDEFTAGHEEIYKTIEMLCKKSIVAMSTQTIFGRVDMNVYSPGRKLIEAGVIGNYSDMTPETTFIKLAWLISNFSKNEIIEKNLILKNFKGELSKRIGDKFIVE